MASTLKLKMQILSEEQEQADLLHKCAQNEHAWPELAWIYHVPNGGWRGKQAGARLKRAGVKPGVPDLQLDVARGGYHGLRCELKRVQGGTLSVEQKVWRDWLTSQGYCFRVCKGASEAWAFLIWYLECPPTEVVLTE